MTFSIIAGHSGWEPHGGGGFTTEPTTVNGKLFCIEHVANGGYGEEMAVYTNEKIDRLYAVLAQWIAAEEVLASELVAAVAELDARTAHVQR